MSEIFKPHNIVWIKNITNKEFGSAYMNEESKFVLHITNQFENEILKPKVGEIIILYQEIKGKGKVFTHLVTPIDDEKVKEKNRENFTSGRNVRIIAKSPPNRLIYIKDTLWSTVNFRHISRGGHIYGIEKLDEYEDLVFDIWKNFTPFFTSNSLAIEYLLKETLTDFSPNSEGVSEGDEKLIKHIIRERDNKIVREKKLQALQENKLKCNICQFSFIEKFAVEFIECHHIEPISKTGSRITKLDDLELVCANCHRMLHKKQNGKYPTINELKDMIAQNTNR